MKSKNFSWVLILVGTLFSTVITSAQSDTPAGFFGYQISFPTGEPGDFFSPRACLNVADLNGDGKEDVILIGRAGRDESGLYIEEIRIYLNNTPDEQAASPTFNLVTVIPHTQGPCYVTRLMGLSVADVNVDNVLDLVATDGCGTALIVYLGHGDGTFSAPISSSVGEPHYSPEWNTDGIPYDQAIIKDINLDGNPDALVRMKYSASIAVLMGDGSGIFGEPTYLENPFPPLVLFKAYPLPILYLEDMTGDLIPDIVTGMYSYGAKQKDPDIPCPPEIYPDCGTFSAHIVFPGNGDGTFGSPTAIGSSIGVLADFTNDGALDAVFIHGTGGADEPTELHILKGTNDIAIFETSSCVDEYVNTRCEGEFAAGPAYFKTWYPSGKVVWYAARPELAEDFDLDGNTDIFGIGNTGYCYLGNGDGTFVVGECGGSHTYTTPEQILLSRDANDFASGDITLNGKPDVVLTHRDNKLFSILPNTTPPVITSLSLPSEVVTPATVSIDISAEDPDGQIELVEWYPRGYDWTIDLGFDVVFRYSVLGIEGGIAVEGGEAIGIEILDFLPDSPLAAAGASVGDIIKSVNGYNIYTRTSPGPWVIKLLVDEIKPMLGRSVDVSLEDRTVSVDLPRIPRPLSQEELVREFQYSGSGLIEPLVRVHDNLRATASASQSLQLIANQPPIANAGDDQTDVPVGPDCMASVTLDGSQSSDPDGDPLTYSWTWHSGSASGVSPTVLLPLGTHTISLVVSDGNVDSEPDSVEITVIDDTPPTIELSDPESVNVGTGKGKMANKLTVSAEDNCSEAAEIEINIDEVEVFNKGGKPVKGKGVYYIDGYDIYVYPNGKGWSICVTITATDSSAYSATERICKPLLKSKK